MFRDNLGDRVMARLDERQLTIQGPVGRLEAKLGEPKQADSIVILCHPHPDHHGSMDNKVITTLARACQRIEIATLRFNFRGVGNSEGYYSGGVGERMDLEFVGNWLAKYRPQLKQAVAGFSFGSAMAVAVSTFQPFQWLITVAPPVDRDYWPVLPAKFDWYKHWLIVHGDQDQVVEPQTIASYWSVQLKQQPVLRWLTGSDHFFHGKLVSLREIVQLWLNG
jgi:hypothetical protein